MKYLQVSLFYICGVFAVFLTNENNMLKVVFVGYGMILSYQYKFFQKNFLLKTTGILSLFLALQIFYLNRLGEFNITFAIVRVVFTIVFVYLFYLAFSEEIKQYSRENSELREEFERNRPFIQFGKNVAGVVHNLKSRFMAIDGFSDLIDEIGDSDVKHYAELQKDAATQILAVIDNLLSTVRSYQRAKREPLLLHKLAYGALEMLRSNMDFKHGIRVSTDFIEDDKIFASPLEILQLLDNLLKNAQEAMQGSERADLSIRTRREGAFVRLSIRDTGVGISHCPACSKRDCLRCPHFEVGNTTKENGTGLGMVFVKELVREMDGRLVIESAPGEGTSVDIWFPFFAGTVNPDTEEADARAAG